MGSPVLLAALCPLFFLFVHGNPNPNICAQQFGVEKEDQYCTHVELDQATERTLHTINAAGMICEITPEAAQEPEQCLLGFSYGSEENSVFGAYDCYGKFNICYAPGQCEEKLLSSSDNNTRTWTPGGTVFSVRALTTYTDTTCDFNTNFNKTTVMVENGCEAVFKICHGND